ncbi:murein biosynthesis integral membrane protein MurJ [bacterium]|nr:murein biosynthesis integral membrane protein MurJ [bacterium]
MNNRQPYSTKKMVRSAGMFGGVTMVSRVLGLVRDVLSASLFGTSGFWDAFVVAFTIPNMFRMLLGEGALSGAFVPVFTQYMQDKGEDKAWVFANRVLSFLSVFLIGLITVGILIILVCFRFDISDRLKEVLILSIILLPYMFFICNVGLLMGILNSFYHFFLPAFNPVILNVVLIAIMSLLAVSDFLSIKAKIVVLCFGVLFGGFLQFSLHFIAAVKKGLRYSFSLRYSEGVKKVWLLMLPAVLGLSINQINLMVDRFLAFKIGAGIASSLYYSNRLIQLPIGVFGVALATVSFPLLTHHSASGNMDDFKKVLSNVLKISFRIALPATIGLLLLAYPITRMIFEHKQFDCASTAKTAFALGFYSLGLLGYCSNKIIIRGFYSLQDTVTPMRIGLVALVVNITLNLILMVPLKGGGLALSTSITSFLSFFMLVFFLRKKIGVFLQPDFFRSLKISFVCTAVMAFFAFGSYRLISIMLEPGVTTNIISALMPVIIGIGAYLSCLVFIDRSELDEMFYLFHLKK